MPKLVSVAICAAGCIFLWSMTGCGSKHAYKTVKRSGTIKFDDGSIIPATRIELKFYSQADRLSEKTGPKWGVSEVEVSDGSFSVINTYEYDDGIIPGKHKVVAMALNERNVPTKAIPKDCRASSTTPLEIDTDDGDITIVIPQP